MQFYRHRWFILALVFLGVNIRAVSFRAGAGDRARPELEVSFDPGPHECVQSNQVIAWQFSRPVHTGPSGRAWLAEGPVVFRPRVDGEFRWIQPDRLEFRPEKPWRSCVDYSAVLQPDKLDTGHPFTRWAREFSFSTAPLLLTAVYQAHRTAQGQVHIGLEFNAPVRAEVLRKHLYFSTTDHTGVPVRVMTEGAETLHLVQLGPLSAEHVTLHIRRGMQGVRGPRGIPQNIERVIFCPYSLQVLKTAPHITAFEGGFVECRFSHALDIRQAVDYIETIPPVNNLSLVSTGNRWQRNRYRLHGDFAAGSNYTLVLRQGLPTDTGAKLDGDLLRNVYFPDRPAGLCVRQQGIYLSSMGRMLLPVETVNVRTFKIRAWRVPARNLVQFVMRRHGNYHHYWGDDHADISYPVAEAEWRPDHRPNQIVKTAVPLRELLQHQTNGIFRLDIDGDPSGHAGQLVVLTDIGISIRKADHECLVWANSLRTLQPVELARVCLYTKDNRLLAAADTDKQGIARLTWAPGVAAEPFLAVVEKGADCSWIELQDTEIAIPYTQDERPRCTRPYDAFVFTDCGVYRPGTTARVTAVIRTVPDRSCAPAFPVDLHVVQPDGSTRTVLTAMPNRRGVVEFSMGWHAYDPVGRYTLRLQVPGNDEVLGHTAVRVEEFVPPTLEADFDVPYAQIQGLSPFNCTVRARHLFGAPAAGHHVKTVAFFADAPFAPAQWPGYSFVDTEKKFAESTRTLGSTFLDHTGQAQFTCLPDREWDPPGCIRATLAADVMEKGGRSVCARAHRLLHARPWYIGLQASWSGRRLPTGSTGTIQVVAVLPDGSVRRQQEALKVEMLQVNWTYVLRRNRKDQYEWVSQRHVQPVRTDPLALDEGRGSHAICFERSGHWIVRVSCPGSGISATLPICSVKPGQQWLDPGGAQPDQVKLSLDRDAYAPGEQAELLIQAPFSGKALVTVEDEKVRHWRVVDIKGNTATVLLPVRAAYRPNAHCCVSLIRPVKMVDRWCAHRAVGRIPLPVDMSHARLGIDIQAPAVSRPADRLRFRVAVTNAAGRPAQADVILAAVDEGICMLTAFKTPDPFSYFCGLRKSAVSMFDLYTRLFPELSAGIAARRSHIGGGAAGVLRGRLNPVDAQRFKPVVLWTGCRRTDEQGVVMYELAVPEFSGTLRLMAVAVTSNAYGSAEQAVQIRRPWVVRTSLPRFMAPGDRCRMPLTIYNTGTGVLSGTVRLELDGATRLITSTGSNHGPAHAELNGLPAGATCNGTPTQEWRLAPHGEQHVDGLIQASTNPGIGRIRLQVVSADDCFDKGFEVPVRPACGMGTRHGSGMIPAGTVTGIAPYNAWMGATGAGRLTVSGMPRMEWAGALAYLLRYPYGCLEQTVSAVLPLLYLPDLVRQAAPGSMDKEPGHFIQSALYRVLSMQQSNGGFALWPHTREVHPWVSVYAAHFLALAEVGGYPVPASRRDAACAYLEKLVKNRDENSGDREISIYAARVLAMYGIAVSGWTGRWCDQWSGLSRPARLHLVGALLAQGKRRAAADMLKRIPVIESAVPVPEESAAPGSSLCYEALLLELWLEVDPRSPNVPMLVRRILRQRAHGRWSTTQDNAAALVALGRYARYAWPRQQHFQAEVYIGERVFHASPTNRVCRNWPDAVPEKVRIRNQGPGPVYYCWTTQGASRDEQYRETDQGMRVRRSLWDRAGVPVTNSVLRQGELYVVKWTVKADRKLEHVVIEDLLPAGLEIENAALKTAFSALSANRKSTLRIQHLERRDDRLIAFPKPFHGCREYYYTVRAVTPGRFTYPALQASCMYDPGIRSVHGRGRIAVQRMEPEMP
jgi:hypothetical protein